MKYIKMLLPFWFCNDIGLLSKIVLTYVSVIMGCVTGLGCVISSFYYGLGLDPYVLIIFFMGIFFVLHYYFVVKGFASKDPKSLQISIVMLGLAFVCYRGIIIGAFLLSIWGIPLFNAKRAFIKNSTVDKSISL